MHVVALQNWPEELSDPAGPSVPLADPLSSLQRVFFKKISFYLYVCAFLPECMPCTWRCPQRSEEVADPMELELQAVVNFKAWVLGTKLGSSRREASTTTPLSFDFSLRKSLEHAP